MAHRGVSEMDCYHCIAKSLQDGDVLTPKPPVYSAFPQKSSLSLSKTQIGSLKDRNVKKTKNTKTLTFRFSLRQHCQQIKTDLSDPYII